jgi:hypothetical protein
MDEAPQLQPRNQMQESPRCADGTLLREVALSRANCNEKQQRDDEDLLASCSESQGTRMTHDCHAHTTLSNTLLSLLL